MTLISLLGFLITLGGFRYGITTDVNVASNCTECNASASKLLAVTMITRHGDRAPATSYPLDPHLNYSWPGGLGALSPKGAAQLYQSGLIKSMRYSPLFSIICLNEYCNFDVDKIYVLSSPIQRCIDSATSFLDAFLRVGWSLNLINVIPLDRDEMLTDPGIPCPKYDRIKLDINHPDIRKIIDFQSPEGLELESFIKNNTGMDKISPVILLALHDLLFVERNNGLQWPEWASTTYDKYLTPMAEIIFDQIISRKHGELRSGVHLKDIIDRLEMNLNGTSEQNILFYSAHDMTIARLMHILEIKNQTTVIQPAYGAMLVMELYENGKISNDFEIKILYYSKGLITFASALACQ